MEMGENGTRQRQDTCRAIGLELGIGSGLDIMTRCTEHSRD